MEFKDKIAPFFWVEHQNSVSVCLTVGKYKADVFQTREDEGFEGNGYDWTSLAQVFLCELMPDLTGIVQFDPEADMFCAYSSNVDALRKFIVAFKNACEKDTLIKDLFSRAELD
jgi:hypothetical protein